jgi:hypothetical protein
LPKQLLTLIDHEDKAVAIHDFQSIIIHGLLQNAEYARALISASRTCRRTRSTTEWQHDWLGKCSPGGRS